MATLAASFSLVFEQLKVVNPQVELVTKGINPYYKVVGGEILIPEGIDEDEEEE